MISRGLGIALLISLSLHVFSMTAVKIITPEDISSVKPFTRVDFLGPVLKKTAFDFMVENAAPVMSTTYRYDFAAPLSGYLDVTPVKRQTGVQEFPVYLERNMDGMVLDLLEGVKITPDFDLEFGRSDLLADRWAHLRTEEDPRRRIIYRPEPPSVMPGVYDGRDMFRIRVQALVAADGKVREVVPLTTTGYPNLDMIVSKFVRSWIFEPLKNYAAADQRQEIEVVLKTGD